MTLSVMWIWEKFLIPRMWSYLELLAVRGSDNPRQQMTLKYDQLCALTTSVEPELWNLLNQSQFFPSKNHAESGGSVQLHTQKNHIVYITAVVCDCEGSVKRCIPLEIGIRQSSRTWLRESSRWKVPWRSHHTSRTAFSIFSTVSTWIGSVFACWYTSTVSHFCTLST